MSASWIEEEMSTLDLKDKRLNRRARRLLQQLASRPQASLPAACGGQSELTAAYRFFGNPKTSFQAVLQPHFQKSQQRVGQQPTVLLVQDTTELDLTRAGRPVQGAGSLNGTSRQGVLLHVLHAFTPEGVSLGTVGAKCWVRQVEPGRQQRRKQIPIEQKESFRWLEGYREACRLQDCFPEVELVCVADSEGDIYELLAEGASRERPGWIIRGCYDRALAGELGGRLRQRLLSSPVVYRAEVEVRPREPKLPCDHRPRHCRRGGRVAKVEVRAARVCLRAPHRPDRQLEPAQVGVVLVREVSAPAGEEPVEWLLLTNLAVETPSQVRRVVEYYAVRWMVEVFFRVLKTGCAVEDRRFAFLDRLLPCVGLFLIVAWRVLFLCRLGRACGELDCEVVFEPEEWKAAYWIVHRRAPPQTPPRLDQMIQMVAQLGGYLPRRGGFPGPETLWRGMTRLLDMAQCWRTFGPESRASPGQDV